MKHQRQVILFILLSLLFFALFVSMKNSNQSDIQHDLQNAETVKWNELALTGTLVAIEEVDLQRNVVQINLSDGSKTVRFAPPDKAWIEAVAVAVDGRLLITYSPPPSPDLPHYSQTNLYQLENGHDPRLLLAQNYPDDLFTQPTWSPDGSLYFTHQQPSANGYTLAIERYYPEQQRIEHIANDAMWTALAPDGQLMAYVHYDSTTGKHRLMAAHPDGSNPSVLLESDLFADLSAPFFSPDSREIYFAASETPSHEETSLFGVGTAKAHGDISLMNWWRISREGGQPERVTKLATVVQGGVFSPDGNWIAFSAVDGVYLMTPDAKEVIRVAAFKAGESIAWLPCPCDSLGSSALYVHQAEK